MTKIAIDEGNQERYNKLNRKYIIHRERANRSFGNGDNRNSNIFIRECATEAFCLDIEAGKRKEAIERLNYYEKQMIREFRNFENLSLLSLDQHLIDKFMFLLANIPNKDEILVESVLIKNFEKFVRIFCNISDESKENITNFKNFLLNSKRLVEYTKYNGYNLNKEDKRNENVSIDLKNINLWTLTERVRHNLETLFQQTNLAMDSRYITNIEYLCNHIETSELINMALNANDSTYSISSNQTLEKGRQPKLSPTSNIIK